MSHPGGGASHPADAGRGHRVQVQRRRRQPHLRHRPGAGVRDIYL